MKRVIVTTINEEFEKARTRGAKDKLKRKRKAYEYGQKYVQAKKKPSEF